MKRISATPDTFRKHRLESASRRTEPMSGLPRPAIDAASPASPPTYPRRSLLEVSNQGSLKSDSSQRCVIREKGVCAEGDSSSA